MANTSGRSTAKEENDATVTEAEQTLTETRKEKPIVLRDIDPDQFVMVRNGFQGKLVYKSPRTGEVYVWDEFGAEQEMDLRELKRAKNTLKKFFINNWFMFDEEWAWVIDYLGVGQYYKYTLDIDHFDEIFTKKSSELKKILGSLSDGQKQSVAYRARQLIADKKLDSLSTISTIEEELGIELIEK